MRLVVRQVLLWTFYALIICSYGRVRVRVMVKVRVRVRVRVRDVSWIDNMLL